MKKIILSIMLLLFVMTATAGNIEIDNVWNNNNNGYDKITTIDADTLEGQTAAEIITAAEYDDTKLIKKNKRQDKKIKINSGINTVQSSLIVGNVFGILNNKNGISIMKSKEKSFLEDNSGISSRYMKKYLSTDFMDLLLENFALKTELRVLQDKVDYLMAKDQDISTMQYQLDQGNGYAGWSCNDKACVRRVD